MRRRRREHHIRTQIIPPGTAIVTVATRNPRLDGDAVADLQVRDGAPDRGDSPAGFVAEHDGAGEDEVPDAAPLPVVDVGHADASLGDAHEDIVGVLKGRDGESGEGELFEGFEEERGINVGCSGGVAHRCGGEVGGGDRDCC